MSSIPRDCARAAWGKTTTSSSRFVTHGRALALLGLTAGPLAWIIWRAAADPAIALLPRGDGAWVRQIDQDVVDTSTSAARNEADFRRTYDTRVLQGATTLSVRAFGAMQVSVNGRALVPLTVGSDWKHVTEFTLPVVLGTSLLAVRVRNQIGIPLLQVLAPPALRTPIDWLAARGPSFDDAAPVASPLHRPPRPGPLQLLPAWRWLRYVVLGWIVGSITVVAAAGFRMLRTPAPGPPRRRPQC